MAEFLRFDREFLRTILSLATKDAVDHLLMVTDVPLTTDDLRGRRIKSKLLYAVASEKVADRLRKRGFRAVLIPPYEFAPIEKAKVAIVAGVSAGHLQEDELVMCAITRTGTRNVDLLLKLTIGQSLDEQGSIDTLNLPKEFNSQVVESIVSLALAVGHQGFEGHPIGTIFVVGDSTRVMEQSRQLTINPFQGLPESERNVMDPTISEALKNFSVLDGAFVIREDGVVLAAGRYLQASADTTNLLPLGLGARHAAAAAITRTTGAISVSVSQSTGTVRVFQDGEVMLELHQVARRIGLGREKK
jgi:DNA integrity scanning protein DisA with diadenylate cyclase activity